MKKLITTTVLSLCLICNNSFAKETALACSKKFKGKVRTHSIIINDDDKILIFNGDDSHKIAKWNKNFISFNPSNLTKSQIQMEEILDEVLGPTDEYRLDRITGYLNGDYKCEVVTKPKF